ncbi:gamma-glutamyltransferase [Alteromonas sp. C1M14]|uniref:gamma-glutamyltransferase n=1 Tax=Alteromonas sp. C1M14 TaxID=2841567 RepID=UPI001C095CC6|nr:gamma-glutamyltransferase [Alteromonas sp. C1M14]MBU2978709.1 gamma-glutamyltransferase [Alteromonas sp. C1M14]
MRLLFLSLLLCVTAGCSEDKVPAPKTTTEQTVAQQAVSMPDSFAADAAMAVLNEGGNAVDAAITAQFVLAVTFPEAGNIGGGGFMTIYYDKAAAFLDYREMAPAAAHRDMYLDENGDVNKYESLFGAKASGIPGSVAGMWQAHQRFGKLPWARLVQPAVDLAKDGFHVPPKLADKIDRYLARMEKEGITSNFPRYFSAAREAGVLFKQPELADSMMRIRDEGAKGFYEGKTAKVIAQYMAENGGLVTEDDLLSYEAKWRDPIVYPWQDYKLITAPPPSSGGVAVAQWINMLNVVLETHKLPAHDSAEYIHLMSEIGKRVFADRAEYLGDPDYVEVPVAKLLDSNYIARRAAEVNPDSISVTEDVKPGLYESPDTTHFSVMDKWGNAVANTTTINLSFGSGVVAEGAGFLLNDEMDDFSAKAGVPNFFGAIGGKANEIQPGKRMLSSMTPTIVLQGNQVKLVTGSPGGTTIISSVAQSILNALFFDMNAEQSANSPRFHHQLWPKDTIAYHSGLAPEVVEKLKAMGYTMKQSNFGDVHLIKRTDKGLEAGSEARGRGKAIVEETTL